MTMSLAYESKPLVECENSGIYNSQLKIKSKWKNILITSSAGCFESRCTASGPKRRWAGYSRSGGGD